MIRDLGQLIDHSQKYLCFDSSLIFGGAEPQKKQSWQETRREEEEWHVSSQSVLFLFSVIVHKT